jgi:O-antigen ligase
MISKSIKFEQAYFWIAIFTLSIFFVAPKISTIGLILLLLFFIVGLIKKHVVFQWNKPLFFGSLLYLAYAIGSVFTFENSDRIHYLESKISFFLIPLLFSISFKEYKPNYKVVVYFLWISLLIATILCFVHALNLTTEQTKGESPFFGVYYSYIHHPSYWVAMTQVTLIVSVVLNRRFQLKLPVLFWVFALVLVLLNTYLSGSLAGMLGLLITLALLFLYKLIHWLSWIKALLLSSLFVCGFFILFLKVNFVQTAVQPIKVELKRYFKDPRQYIKDEVDYKTGDQKRLIMWWVAVETIQEKPFGVGTGNVDYYSTKKLHTYKQFELAKEELNPHNQYLQIGVELGVFGIILLIFIFLSLVVSGIINKDLILFSIGSIMIVNALFESILQKSSGIFFFTFIVSFSFFLLRNKSHFLSQSSK